MSKLPYDPKQFDSFMNIDGCAWYSIFGAGIVPYNPIPDMIKSAAREEAIQEIGALKWNLEYQCTVRSLEHVKFTILLIWELLEVPSIYIDPDILMLKGAKEPLCETKPEK